MTETSIVAAPDPGRNMSFDRIDCLRAADPVAERDMHNQS
jgi:hypothetical protein